MNGCCFYNELSTKYLLKSLSFILMGSQKQASSFLPPQPPPKGCQGSPPPPSIVLTRCLRLALSLPFSIFLHITILSLELFVVFQQEAKITKSVPRRAHRQDLGFHEMQEPWPIGWMQFTVNRKRCPASRVLFIRALSCALCCSEWQKWKWAGDHVHAAHAWTDKIDYAQHKGYSTI